MADVDPSIPFMPIVSLIVLSHRVIAYQPKTRNMTFQNARRPLVLGRPGATVEQIHHDLRMLVIGGGSEEMITDLAVRQLELAMMSDSKLESIQARTGN
ncbi:hypothetical protein E4U41_001540 [Claviceps citrina]|nr:hypothetical protein E4U41_001540 [Claviceps citrina]